MLLFDGGLGGRQARSDRGERLGDVNRHIARLAALGLLGLLRVGPAESQAQADNREKGPTAFTLGSPHHILPDWCLADIPRIPDTVSAIVYRFGSPGQHVSTVIASCRTEQRSAFAC